MFLKFVRKGSVILLVNQNLNIDEVLGAEILLFSEFTPVCVHSVPHAD